MEDLLEPSPYRSWTISTVLTEMEWHCPDSFTIATAVSMVTAIRPFKYSNTFFSCVCPQFVQESGNSATGISAVPPDHDYKSQHAPVIRTLQTEPHRSLDSLAFEIQCNRQFLIKKVISMGTAGRKC